MASSATNSEDSFSDRLVRSTSSLRPVDKQIMKWNTPGVERSNSDEDKNPESDQITGYHKPKNIAGLRLDDATKTLDLLQAEKSRHRNSSLTRGSQRKSGSFLLPDFIPRSSPMTGNSSQNHRRNNYKKTHEKTNGNTRSVIAAQGEILHSATKNKSAVQDHDETIQDTKKSRQKITQPEQADYDISETSKTGLHMDSAHIVNLALNLNESRKVASRRTMLNNSNVVDSTADGNLWPQPGNRQPLSQYHSKNDKIGRMSTQSATFPEPGTDKTHLHTTFNLNLNQAYTYRFSRSTLARSEKAKTTFELMAQYRRLLNFVSPLTQNPDRLQNSKTASSLLSDYSENLVPTMSQNFTRPTRQLGRSYNLLQYIRNRKLRARISKSIDAEAQGFGDVEKVSCWADDVARVASSSVYQTSDKISLPKFPGKPFENRGSDTSPEFCTDENQKAPIKVRRPRIEWSINPADLIADLYWLEQDENKNIIEDRSGNPIFAKDFEFRRSKIDETWSFEPHTENSPINCSREPRFDLRSGTDAPLLKSFKLGVERSTDKASIGGPLLNINISDKTLFQFSSDIETHHASYRNPTRSRSRSLSSASGRGLRSHRRDAKSNPRNSNTIIEKERNDSHFIKGMKKEALSFEDKLSKKSKDSLKPSTDLSSEAHHYRKNSTLLGTDTLKNGYQNQRCNDARDIISRNSGEYRESMSDSTTSSSPWKKTEKYKDSANTITGPALPLARNPTRRQSDGLENKWKRHPSDSTTSMNQSSDSKKLRGNSVSSEKAFSKLTSESEKKRKNSTDLRRTKGEQVSGIRGFLKNARNPVSRVSDYFWRKDSATGQLPGPSIDDSDPEDLTASQAKVQDLSIYRRNNDDDSSRGSSALVLSGKDEITFQQETLPLLLRDKSIITNLPELDIRSNNAALQQNLGQPLGRDRFHNDYNNNSPTSSLDQDNILRSDSGTSESSNQRPISTATSEANAGLNAILSGPSHPPKLSSFMGHTSLEVSDRGREYDWKSDNPRTSTKVHVTTKEIARIRTLLLSSGIKAKEIHRKVDNLKSLTTKASSSYINVNTGAQSPLIRVPITQRHDLAFKMLSEDIKCSSSKWNSSLEKFSQTTSKSLTKRITTLQTQLAETLMPLTRTAANEADLLSRDLVTDHRLAVTHVIDQITQMTQRRRARFRWVRRGGWLILEWVLIGIMWWVWFIVVITRIFLGTGKLIIGGVRWLFWL